MDNIIRLLVEAAEALDAQGLRAIADKVDKVANKTFEVKTAQYVGIQGYAIRNSRCWGNCYRQKRTSSPNKSAQQVWTECHKEYVESLNNDGSKWDKYAGSENNIKVGSELHAFSQEVNAKIASKVEEKVAEGLDIGSAVYASIEEVANEPNELMISASNEIMDIASRLVSNPEIAEKLTAAAEEMVKEAGIMDFFKGVGQGVKNWGSNQAYTGKLKQTITDLDNSFKAFEDAYQKANQTWGGLSGGIATASQQLNIVANDPNSTPQQKQQASTAIQHLSNVSGLIKAKDIQGVRKNWPNTLTSLNSILRGNYGGSPSGGAPSAPAAPSGSPAGGTPPAAPGVNPAASSNPLGGAAPATPAAGGLYE
jgi:Mor family transcriptional regulator